MTISRSEQLVFETITHESQIERDAAIDRYVREYRSVYCTYARHIRPDLRDWTQIWDRFAFAILTANTTVESAVNAFRLARSFRTLGIPYNARSAIVGVVPERFDYVSKLPTHSNIFTLRLRTDESWDAYRMRLARTVEGLAITKASYAACLLYPLQADVACLDTWMLRLLLGSQSFVSITIDEYKLLEQHVRIVARRHRISTALAQWAMWDWARTRYPTPQRFFDV